jgi:hypothetical protein
VLTPALCITDHLGPDADPNARGEDTPTPRTDGFGWSVEHAG